MKTPNRKKSTKPPLFLKNKFSYGLVIGFLLPFLAYGTLYIFDQSLISSKTVRVTSNSHFMWTGFKASTLILMAFCVNLIPTYFANKQYKEEFIRGIMIPTVLYCFVWFFYYRDSFL
jgi:hypothetical protein